MKKLNNFGVGFFCGAFLLVVSYITFNGGLNFESTYEFSRCATGQDLSHRDTAGTAVYVVRFKDGDVVSYKCAKPFQN